MQDLSLPSSALRREAFDLFSALDAYELASTLLVERWPDAQAYADFAQRIEAIREHGLAMPALTVLSLQLAIAHSELVSSMWQDTCAPLKAAVLQEVRLRHAIALEALRIAAAKLVRNA